MCFLLPVHLSSRVWGESTLNRNRNVCAESSEVCACNYFAINFFTVGTAGRSMHTYDELFFKGYKEVFSSDAWHCNVVPHVAARLPRPWFLRYRSSVVRSGRPLYKKSHLRRQDPRGSNFRKNINKKMGSKHEHSSIVDPSLNPVSSTAVVAMENKWSLGPYLTFLVSGRPLQQLYEVT